MVLIRTARRPCKSSGEFCFVFRSEMRYHVANPCQTIVSRSNPFPYAPSRCFDVLGFDEYLEGHADGLQILRYNVSNAYTAHMDYMTSRPDEPFDYDSAHVGGNRYATILLYMSDLKEGDGGETVFPKALPPDVPESERVELDDAIAELRASNATKGILEEGSWEEKLTAQCRTRLAVRPNSARAVLFYSQLPDGRPDPMSKHGACPMINGEKWAANVSGEETLQFPLSVRLIAHHSEPFVCFTFSSGSGIHHERTLRVLRSRRSSERRTTSRRIPTAPSNSTPCFLTAATTLNTMMPHYTSMRVDTGGNLLLVLDWPPIRTRVIYGTSR
jgi:hypothetical protein